MGNWTYEIFFQQRQTPAPDIFRQVIRLAAQQGFGLDYPADVLRLDGMGITEQPDEVAFVEMVGTQGGHFLLGHGGEDIHVTFDAAHWRLSFAALHDGNPHDEIKALALENLLTTLCREIQPRYAYAYDEEHLEKLFANFDFLAVWQMFIRSIGSGEKPQLLFWLNYFDAGYFATIGDACLTQIDYRREKVDDQGIFIYLADRPWNARVALLREDGIYYSLGEN